VNYIIKIMSDTSERSGYYSVKHRWQYSRKEIATRLTHKEARAIMGKLKSLGYKAVMELA
jgi:hypothetical protein